MPLDVVQTLGELVRIPSVNPMGRPVSGEQYFEHAVTDYLQQLFDRLGLPWQRQQVAPRRSNILARLDGDIPPEQGGQVLMFEAHQDTVPVEGMTIAPWSAEVRDGRLYGRGACDIKGGMASMLVALSRLAAERPAGRPTIVMACSVNEEYGYGGALEIAGLWSDGVESIFPCVPDAAIVAEPTLLNVVVAHKGVVRWRCQTRGRAAHSSQPEQGENAIYHMARVLTALEHYARETVSGLGQHRLVGRPTLSVGVISGGLSVNTVPDHCMIEIDRRVLPGEDPTAARGHVLDYLASQLPSDTPIEHDEAFITGSGLADDINQPLAERLSQIVRQQGGPGEQIGVPYGTDAPAYAAGGVPSVVFGPGSIEQAHTADEWIAIEQLEQAAEILYQFGKQGLGRRP